MTFMFNFTTDNDWRRTICDDLIGQTLREDGIRMSIVDIENDSIGNALMASFDFMNAHGNGRYTDRTLMAIQRWANRLGGADLSRRRDICGQQTNTDSPTAPRVIVAEKNYSYDPDTETKTGGVLGMLTLLPNIDDESYRGVIAVSAQGRRRGIGTALINASPIEQYCDSGYLPIYFYASAANFLAMRLAAATCLKPRSVDGGIVQYAR